MCSIAGTEETLGADKQVRIVFAPEHAAAVLKRVFDSRDSMRHGLDDVETATNIEGTAFISQSHRLLRRQGITSAPGIVINVATGCLIDEPLAHVPFVC